MNNKAINEFGFRRILKNYADLGGCYPLSSICIILHILRKPNSLIANYMISRMLPGLRSPLLDPPNAQQYFEIYVPVCKGNINIQVRENGNGKIYLARG